MKQICSPLIKAYQGGIIASTISHLCLLQSLDAASPEPTSETSAVASEQGGFSSTLENAAYGQGRGLFFCAGRRHTAGLQPSPLYDRVRRNRERFRWLSDSWRHRHVFPLLPSNGIDWHKQSERSPLPELDAGGMSLGRLENVPGAARMSMNRPGRARTCCASRYPCPSGFNDQGQMNGVCSVCVCSVPVSSLWLTSLATSLRSGTCMRGLTTQGQRIPKFREIDTCIITSTRCSIVPIETKSRTS